MRVSDDVTDKARSPCGLVAIFRISRVRYGQVGWEATLTAGVSDIGAMLMIPSLPTKRTSLDVPVDAKAKDCRCCRGLTTGLISSSLSRSLRGLRQRTISHSPNRHPVPIVHPPPALSDIPQAHPAISRPHAQTISSPLEPDHRLCHIKAEHLSRHPHIPYPDNARSLSLAYFERSEPFCPARMWSQAIHSPCLELQDGTRSGCSGISSGRRAVRRAQVEQPDLAIVCRRE